MSMKQDNALRLLIVDDRVEDAEALVSGLRNAGIAVRPVRAASAEELSAALAGPADLVLAAFSAQSLPFAEAAHLVASCGKDLPLVAIADQLDEALYDAALTAERSGRPELLETHLQHLLTLRPDHAHALNALGYSWADRNVRLAEAHDLIARALELLPDDPFITDSLGWVQYRLGRLEDARQTLERAYRSKADPEIAAHLGEVLWSLGRQDEARQLLTEAARQHPDSEVLAGAIKKLLP